MRSLLVHANAAGRMMIERGTEWYDVMAEEVFGEQRDDACARQSAQLPSFVGCLEQNKGLRDIPVLRLTRA